jgi:hypothetical protein
MMGKATNTLDYPGHLPSINFLHLYLQYSEAMGCERAQKEYQCIEDKKYPG